MVLSLFEDEDAKERMYDIHPLLRKYADSIKNDAKFQRAYLEAKGRFHQHFMSEMELIAKLIEPDYVTAFNRFEADRPNYEFTVDISLQPEYFSVPGEFHKNALIASFFSAMLTENKQIKLFHSWAEMCKEDGESGKSKISLLHSHCLGSSGNAPFPTNSCIKQNHIPFRSLANHSFTFSEPVMPKH